LVALFNRRDALHESATELAARWARRDTAVVTSDAVLIELANFFSRSPLRAACASAMRQIRAGSGWTIERLVPKLVARGAARYAIHADKSWSLTDCISMEVMLDHELQAVATPDHHFEQAGFRVLMPKSTV
jgi:predicted nucleic acid-binding protein